MTTTTPAGSPERNHDPPGAGVRPEPPLLRVLGAIARERERGGDFVSVSAETLDAPGVRPALQRLGYPVVAHNRQTFLVEFPAVRMPPKVT